MTDTVDEVTIKTEEATTESLARIRKLADIPVGIEGECNECEKHSRRLVGGMCAFCRDGR